MRLLLLVLTILSVRTIVYAQTKQDEEAVRNLPKAFCDAFNKHDGHELAKIMAENVDFVTVALTWLQGRADFEKYHTRLLTGRFKEMTFTALETHVRFIRPDLAIVRYSWRGQGDKNADGSARPERFGLMTMLAEKQKDAWLVLAVQNAEAPARAAGQARTAEANDIKSPLVVPRP